MTEPVFPFQVKELGAPRLGLIALQSDESIEGDMRRLMPRDVELMVSRVVSDEDVTSETLAAMEGYLTTAASLFPRGVRFKAVGYGCTSGTAQIGPDQVAEKVMAGTDVATVTQPLSALVAACEALGLRKLTMLSPYVAEVSGRLRDALQAGGIETPVFGSFNVGSEAIVVRIDAPSIMAASIELMRGADTSVDGLFISCTNLRTLDIIDPLEDALGVPVLTSNQVLAWHMMHVAGLRASSSAPGRLFKDRN